MTFKRIFSLFPAFTDTFQVVFFTFFLNGNDGADVEGKSTGEGGVVEWRTGKLSAIAAALKPRPTIEARPHQVHHL